MTMVGLAGLESVGSPLPKLETQTQVDTAM